MYSSLWEWIVFALLYSWFVLQTLQLIKLRGGGEIYNFHFTRLGGGEFASQSLAVREKILYSLLYNHKGILIVKRCRSMASGLAINDILAYGCSGLERLLFYQVHLPFPNKWFIIYTLSLPHTQSSYSPFCLFPYRAVCCNWINSMIRNFSPASATAGRLQCIYAD